jgi:hypothetical protein
MLMSAIKHIRQSAFGLCGNWQCSSSCGSDSSLFVKKFISSGEAGSGKDGIIGKGGGAGDLFGA